MKTPCKRILILVLAFLAALYPIEASASGAAPVGSEARAFLVIEASSLAPVMEKASGEKLPAAGLSRLAALLLICEAFDHGEAEPSVTVTVGEAASRIGGTTAFLRPNERIDAGSLLLAGCMINAGDAIHALAEALFGSAAVDRINARMRQLGVEAVYTDICGRDILLSAAELARIGGALMKSPTYAEYGSKTYELIRHEAAGDTELANPNKLLRQYRGCTGGATGSSERAGYSGFFHAERSGTAFIAVVLGAQNSLDRFQCASALLDLAFSEFRSAAITHTGEAFGKVRVLGSLTGEVEAVAAQDVTVLIGASEGMPEVRAELPETLEAPVKSCGEIGRLVVVGEDGEVLAEAPLVAASGADKDDIFGFLRFVLLGFMRFGHCAG